MQVLSNFSWFISIWRLVLQDFNSEDNEKSGTFCTDFQCISFSDFSQHVCIVLLVDLTRLLTQPPHRPLTASWRLPVWSPWTFPVTAPPVMSAASTKQSSATWMHAGVWTHPTGKPSKDPHSTAGPIAALLSLAVKLPLAVLLWL